MTSLITYANKQVLTLPKRLLDLVQSFPHALWRLKSHESSFIPCLKARGFQTSRYLLVSDEQFDRIMNRDVLFTAIEAV